MEEYNLLYIDDDIDPQISEYLDRDLRNALQDNLVLHVFEHEFKPAEGYKSLLANLKVSSANIILIDSRLFENSSANDGKFSGEEFKIILKKQFPFIEVIVITQNGADDEIRTIAKFDQGCGMSSKEYYDNILPKVIQQAIEQVAIYRNLANRFRSNDSWEPIIKEKVIGSLEGTSEYDSLTAEDIDKLVFAFKEIAEKSMNKDYRDTEYCPGYDKVLENKSNFMALFRTQHPYAKDIHAYVSKNDSALKNDFIRAYYGKCAYCGTSIKIVPKSLFEIDHFVPQSSTCFNGNKAAAGGIDNLVLSCRTCNHNKSDFPVTAGLREMLHPDYDEIKNLFFRDEKYYIRVSDGKPSEVTDFYKQLRLDRQSCRLDYLLLKMKGLYEKTVDRPDVHNLLGQAISLLVEKRNIDC